MSMNKRVKEKIRKMHLYKNTLLYSFFKKRFFVFFEEDLMKEVVPNVTVISAEDTLDQIESFIQQNKRGVYMRFGDGDIFLLKNTDDGFQKSNASLSAEMNESLSLHGQDVFKCLAIHSETFGYSEGMVSGNHKNKDSFALKLFKDSYKYFIGSVIYSPVALHFVATEDPLRANGFLKLLKSKTNVFIGNENVKEETLHLLFGEKVVHIKTPSNNAYDEIDRIEKEAIASISKLDGFSVVCVAMGCSGRPLMKRLWKSDYPIFLFDFGSLLDGIDGNNSRTWLKINNINYPVLLKDL
jgi:hypothetical protein